MSKNELQSSGERRRRVLRMARVNGNKFNLRRSALVFRTAPLDPLYKLHDGNYQHTQK